MSLVEDLPATGYPALFRLHLPVGWRPGTETLERVTREMQRRAHGLRSILLPDGAVARIERTAAFERALRLKADDELLDDAVDTVSETWWSDGARDGFVHVLDEPAPAADDDDVVHPVAVEAAAPVRSADPDANVTSADPLDPAGRHPLARMMTALGKR